MTDRLAASDRSLRNRRPVRQRLGGHPMGLESVRSFGSHIAKYRPSLIYSGMANKIEKSVWRSCGNKIMVGSIR